MDMEPTDKEIALLTRLLDDRIIDSSDLATTIRLFNKESSLENLELLMIAFLINPHGWNTEAFKVISSAFTEEKFEEMRTSSKDRSLVARRLLSFAIDALEETFEEEAGFPHAFVKSAVCIAELFLGLKDPVTLKLWLLRGFFAREGSTDETGDGTQEEVVMKDMLLSMAAGGLSAQVFDNVFAGGIPRHDTGTFIDNNVEEDPLRAARYFYQIARVFNHLTDFAHSEGYKTADKDAALRWIGYSSRVIDDASIEQNVFAKGRRPGHDGMAALQLQRKKTATLAHSIEKTLASRDPEERDRAFDALIPLLDKKGAVGKTEET